MQNYAQIENIEWHVIFYNGTQGYPRVYKDF